MVCDGSPISEAGDGSHEGAESVGGGFSEPGPFEGEVDEMVYHSDSCGGLS